MLAAIAGSLQACLRQSDVLARVGGDEFVLFLDVLDDQAGEIALCENLMQAVNRQLHVGDDELTASCSIGFARYPEHGTDADALLNNAAAAMRHAKSFGGGQIWTFAASLRTEVGRKLTLESHLRRAIERGELFLQYQPKICVRTSAVIGYEALLRWQHPEFGMIAPDEFIPIADETGLIVPIGVWILRQVATQLAAWAADALPSLPIAVNLSARQFMETDLIYTIEQLVREHGLDPGLLELELTESVSMADPIRSSEVMRGLRGLGVALSIDDFGTGYSSFAYLRRFPIDKLKIDRSLIQDMTESPESRAIVEAIVAVAHRLDLEVIAEGVEMADQVLALREIQCDQIQGYYYSRPLSPDACGPYVRAMNNPARPAASRNQHGSGQQAGSTCL